MADKALRVLAAAFKLYDILPSSFEPEAHENELVFIGLACMIDPCVPWVRTLSRSAAARLSDR
jgi:Ca2+-transporting ATPase